MLETQYMLNPHAEVLCGEKIDVHSLFVADLHWRDHGYRTLATQLASSLGETNKDAWVFYLGWAALLSRSGSCSHLGSLQV